MYKFLSIIIGLLSLSLVTKAQIDPQTIVGISTKVGVEDQGVGYYDDMSFGVSGNDMMYEIRRLGVKVLSLPGSDKLIEDDAKEKFISYYRKLREAGGTDLKVFISQRKWDVHVESQQESWAAFVAYIYEAFKAEGWEDMIVGCIFDENRRLWGEQSSKALWDDRHNGVLGALDRLNAKTNDAFKTRTVLIHGKGYGSQFLGVKASSDALDFPAEMTKRCYNYAYNFKFFEATPRDDDNNIIQPETLTLEAWKDHFINYCAFKEVKDLGVPMVFLGDSGEGIRAKSFTSNTYGKPGQYVISALRDVFYEYRWSGMIFGPFFVEKMEGQKSIGRTLLYEAVDGKLIANEDGGVVAAWGKWYLTTRLPARLDQTEIQDYSIYPNPTNCYLNITAGDMIQEICIHSLDGTLLKRFEKNTIKLDVSFLASGVYLLKINNEVKRFIKL